MLCKSPCPAARGSCQSSCSRSGCKLRVLQNLGHVEYRCENAIILTTPSGYVDRECTSACFSIGCLQRWRWHISYRDVVRIKWVYTGTVFRMMPYRSSAFQKCELLFLCMVHHGFWRTEYWVPGTQVHRGLVILLHSESRAGMWSCVLSTGAEKGGKEGRAQGLLPPVEDMVYFMHWL